MTNLGWTFIIFVVVTLSFALGAEFHPKAEAAPQFSIICRNDVYMTTFTVVQTALDKFDYQVNFPEGLSNGTCTVWPSF